jgi:hypothetical protein
MTASLIQSFTVERTIQFSDLSYNGPDWLTEFLSYPNTTCNTPVCAVWCHGRLDKIPSTQVLSALRAASKAVGSACLGFEPSEMGMHSLRSGAAMEMYLARVPVYTIMLIGRWLSNAFLRYIRK